MITDMASLPCADCGNPFLVDLERCPHCARPGLFPNVRTADLPENPRLPKAEPTTEQDWIAFHIRGMALLRLGRTAEAIRTFRKGVESNPRPAQRAYFRTGLALAQLQASQYRDAAEILESSTLAELRDPVNLLRLHAFGLLGEKERAAEALDQLSGSHIPRLAPVRQELKRRFIDGQAPGHSDAWIYEVETAIILAAIMMATHRRRLLSAGLRQPNFRPQSPRQP